MSEARTGVLVMGHGTPSGPDEMVGFLTSIRRGRAPSSEEVADLVRRYDAIGGISPLGAVTRKQVASLEATLEQRRPGGYVVRFGAKHVAPSIEAAAGELIDLGVETIVAIALAPFDADMGAADYFARAQAAVAERDTKVVALRHWYERDGFADLVARRLAALGADPDQWVCFSAHSLPEVLPGARNYAQQVADSASAVATRAGLHRHVVAFQSVPKGAGGWLGPSLAEVIDRTGAGQRLVIVPIGFVSDHLEVLFDIDIEAAALASARGVELVRTTSFNDDPALAALLAAAIIEAT